MKKSSSKTVKEAADHLIVGHKDLDERVRVVATKLGVELPDEPNDQQKGWLQQMNQAQGKEFDRTWANLLRSAHGKIFPAIGTVRNNTQNMMVRQLASDTNQTVLDHITMLEKTGQVDFDAIANGTI
jgi:putative membrane protein